MEALQSFGGCGLDAVLEGSKRKVARTLEARRKKGEQEEEGEEEEEEVEGGKENIVA